MNNNKTFLKLVGTIILMFITPMVLVEIHTNAFQYGFISKSPADILNEMVKINGYSLLMAAGVVFLFVLKSGTITYRRNHVSDRIGEVYFPQIEQFGKVFIRIFTISSIYLLQYHAYLYPFLDEIENGKIIFAATYYNISLLYKIAVFEWLEMDIAKNFYRGLLRKTRYVLK